MLPTEKITLENTKITMQNSKIEVELDFYKAQRVMVDAMTVWWHLWIGEGNSPERGRCYLRCFMQAATKGEMPEGVAWQNWSNHV